MASLDFELERQAFKEYYSDNVTRFDDSRKSMEALLDSVFATVPEIVLSNIEGRVKDRNGCIEKFKRKYQYQLEAKQTPYRIEDCITDIVGLRIVCLYEDDVVKIHKKLEEIFEIIDVTDKISDIEGTEASFGYKGLHLDVKLKDSRLALAEYSNYAGINFEIQIRTVVQDAWSVIDHKIKYKKSIPNLLKRRINTLAALFELADHEFKAIRDETTKEVNRSDSTYAKISKETPLASADNTNKRAAYTPLDVFSFLNIAKHFFPDHDFNDEEVDGFVQDIIRCSPGISRGKFNFYMKTNIAKSKKFIEHRIGSSAEANKIPIVVMKICLLMGENDRFQNFLGPRTRAALSEFIEKEKTDQ